MVKLIQTPEDIFEQATKDPNVVTIVYTSAPRHGERYYRAIWFVNYGPPSKAYWREQTFFADPAPYIERWLRKGRRVVEIDHSTRAADLDAQLFRKEA